MGNKKYFITGGGTGGHIYPAVAVADELLKQGNKIYYVGNPQKLEATIVKDKDYTFLPVKSSGMPRKACFALIGWAFRMFLGWLKCCCYILKYKPDAIFATGGYVSAPVLFAAITTKIPFVMHDCDANPGLVTRKLAPFASSVSVAFEAACEKLNNKNCHINGNPIRSEFRTLSKDEARKSLGLENKMTLCIMGGSQGAKHINQAAVEILSRLTEELDLQVIFQTGKNNYDEVKSQISVENKNLTVRPYFDNMVEVLKASDIAISRAGSLSISEICASGIAPIFIPYPFAASDHQRKNAKYMLKQGAGLYLEDDETTGAKLFDIVKSLVDDKQKLNTIRQTALKMAVYDGAERIVNQINSAM